MVTGVANDAFTILCCLYGQQADEDVPVLVS